MIDLHTHILPSIDDGSPDLETSLAMLKEEVINGVDTVVLTPHLFWNSPQYYSPTELENQFNQFREAAKDIPIKLIKGGEIYYQKGVINALMEGKLPTLGDSKYVLIEFNLHFEYFDIEEVVYSLIIKGFKPIVAHPERYQYLTFDKILSIRNTGALFQINTTSILGKNGHTVQKIADKMLKNDIVDFVASDAHGINHRKPNLKEALEYIKKKYRKVITNSIEL